MAAVVARDFALGFSLWNDLARGFTGTRSICVLYFSSKKKVRPLQPLHPLRSSLKARARRWTTVVAIVLASSAVQCAAPIRNMRSAAAAGNTTRALRLYQDYVSERGASNPDALAEVALALLERLAASSELPARTAGIASLRSLGGRGRDSLLSVAEKPGVAGDRAAAAVYDMDGREGLPPSRLNDAALSSDPERRVAGLAAVEGRHDVVALIAALEARSVDVRRAAAQRLARQSSNQGTMEALGHCVAHDESESVRNACVSALGQYGERAWDLIVPAQADRESFVRMTAANALIAANRTRATTHFAPLFQQPATALSVEVARALSARGDSTAVEFILRTLAGGDPNLRAQAAVAVGAWNDHYDPQLLPFFEDGDVEVRLRVAVALGRRAPNREAAIRAVRPIAASPDPLLAMRALSVLADLGDSAAAAPIRQALQSPERTIRRLAINAWSYLTEANGEVEPLTPLLLDDDVSLRAQAAAEIVRIAAR